MMIPKSCSSVFLSKHRIQANVFIPVLSLLDSKCTQFVLKRTKKNPEPLENTGVPGFDLLFPLVAGYHILTDFALEI